MNKTTLSTLSLLGLLLMLPASGQGRDLLVHSGPGGGDVPGLWICRLDARDPKIERSVLVDRDRSKENQWNEIAQIPSRTALLTNDDAELVVVLAPTRGEAFAREWAWVSPTRFTYGPAFPAGGRIAAMAGGAKGLWALSANPAEPAAIRPSTIPTNPPTTVPTTRPAGRGLTLYQFKGDWKAQPGIWPADLSVLGMGDVFMLVIDDVIHVVARTQNSALRLMKYDSGRWATLAEVVVPVSWKDLGGVEKPLRVVKEVRVTPPPRYFKLLAFQGKPALWIQPGDGEVDPSGSLWTAEGGCKIDMPQGKLRPVAMDLVIVRDQPKLYYLSEDKLNEQTLNIDGNFVGKPQPIVYAPQQSRTPLDWVTITVMAVLTIVILNMVLRRRNDESDEKRDADE